MFAMPSFGRTTTDGCRDARRHLRAAARSEGKERLNLLAEHVLDVWLWTLAQVGYKSRPARHAGIHAHWHAYAGF